MVDAATGRSVARPRRRARRTALIAVDLARFSAGARSIAAGATRPTRWIAENEASALSLAVVCFTSIVGLAVVMLRSFMLPSKFLRDGDTIHRLAASGTPGWAVDESFANVAAIYRILGLQDAPGAAALLGYGSALLVIAMALHRRRFVMTVPGTVAVALSVLFSAVYLGTYSKDVFVLPVVGLVLAIRSGWKRDALLVAALLMYADVFRTYWFLVAAFYVAYRLLDRRVVARWPLFIAPVIALVVLAFAFPAVLGTASDFARFQTNEYRIGSADAATIIGHFIALPGAAGSALNTVLVLLTVFVPVPLLLRGGAYYFAISLCFVALWTAFLLGLRRVQHVDGAAARAVVLLLAFVTTQALFEPDYGSLLRHLTPLMPLICLIALTPRSASRADLGQDGSSAAA